MPASEFYDIAIVGAGAAGVGAAWSAARVANEHGQTLRIALLDQAPHAGGVVAHALHRSLCGLYANHPADPRDTLNAGAARTLVETMLARHADHVRTRAFGKATVLEFPPAAWPAALSEMCDSSAITRQFGVRIIAADRNGDRLRSIRTQDGRTIEATVFIDASGTGQLLALVGDDIARPLDTDRPLGGYAIRLTNLTGPLEPLRLAVPLALARKAEPLGYAAVPPQVPAHAPRFGTQAPHVAGDRPKSTKDNRPPGGLSAIAIRLPAIARLATFYPGPGDSAGVLKLAVAPGDDASELADTVLAVLRSALPAFSDAREVERSPSVQSRDGRRLVGDDTLTEAAVLAGDRRADELALGWWPIEWWGDAGPSYAFAAPDRPYSITRGMLRSAAVKNLFAAGACLSATGRAAASARVSGICLAIGDAAGRLAVETIGG